VRQSLGCFQVDAEGTLTPATSSELDHAAQSLCIDSNDAVYAVGGNDDGEGLLSVFGIDAGTATLTPRGVFRPGPGLMCVISHTLPAPKL
jgi:6-phosphogluconolactonase (cycloisomerase 2 family)